MTQVTFLQRAEKIGSSMMKSHWVWISFFAVFAVSIIAHIPLIHFNVGGFTGGYAAIAGSETKAFEPWLKMIISSAGSVAILAAVMMISKLNRNFMWIGVFGNLMLSLNGALSLLWFEAAKRIFFAGMYIVQWFKWGQSGDLKTERINFMWILIGVGIVGAFVGLGAGMDAIKNATGVNFIAKPYFDAIQTSFFAVGAVLLVRRKAESHVWYFIADILAIIMFVQMQNWTLVITMSVFLLTTIPSYLQWNAAIVKN